MRNRRILFIVLVLLIVTAVFLCACGERKQSADKEKKAVRITVSVPDKSFIIGGIDYSEIILNVYYDDGSVQYFPFQETMIAPGEEGKLSQDGAQQIKVVYNSLTTQMLIDLVQPETEYCRLTVSNGYVSAVNGVAIVRPDIPADGEDFSASYPIGTQVTIHWKDKQGVFFGGWLINGAPGGPTESVITVELTSDIAYTADDTSVFYTVSFITNMPSVVVSSITTNVLNEIDIEKIYGDGYVFLGWTSDEISREQSLNGYDRDKLIKFPYYVSRDVVFRAVWSEIGIDYTLAEDGEGYYIRNFHGNILSLELPSMHAGKPVVGILRDAFETKQGEMLTDIRIPETITEIESGAFRNCLHLKKITVDDASASFTVYRDALYTADKRTLIAYPSGDVTAEYYTAEETETISAHAFNSAAVGGIVLNVRIKGIGDYAFYSAHTDYVDFSAVNPIGLETGLHVFHDYVQKILISEEKKAGFYESEVFSANREKVLTQGERTELGVFETIESDGSTSRTLYRVIVNENFENSAKTAEILAVSRELGYYTLQNQLGGYTVTSVAKEAFAGCVALGSVKIPVGSKLERICDGAFDDTPWTKTLSDKMIKANTVLYKYLGDSQTVKIEGITKIAEGAFSENKTIKYLDIDTNAMLKSICAYAFYECSAFTGFVCEANADGDGVYLRKDITKVGAYAFYGTAVTALKLQQETTATPSALTSIGQFAFAECHRLVSAQLASALTEIAPSAFAGAYSLKAFSLNNQNAVYEVYDGILYKKSDNGYILYSYPAGRMDMEFNAAERLNYATALTKRENAFLGADATGAVGEIWFNGIRRQLYMSVVDSIDPNYLTESSDNVLQYYGRTLHETTDYIIDGSGEYVPNGEKYFYFDKGNGENVYLYYDEESGSYYYPTYLSVTEYGEYCLAYANIAALFISSDVRKVAENAVKIPGLVYVRFDEVPTFKCGDQVSVSLYDKLFAEYAPDFVVIPDSFMTNGVITQEALKFYGNEEKSKKNRTTVPYSFFFSYREASENFDKSVLYAYDNEAEGSVRTYVVRTDRTKTEIGIEEDIYRLEGESSVLVSSETMPKVLFPYAFFGEYLQKVVLRNVQRIRTNAFTEAEGLTQLDLNTDFISDIEENVFGPKLNNGLFIYDYRNGIDLYRTTENWNLECAWYPDENGDRKWFSEYFITSSAGAFAVIMYDENGTMKMYEEKYGKIEPGYAKAVGASVAPTGYMVDKWVDANGNDLSVEETYIIAVNQILVCDFTPKTYTVYLSARSSLTYDYEVESTDPSGLIVYKTEITFGSEYRMDPVNDIGDSHVFLQTTINGQTMKLETSGVWNFDPEVETVQLMTVYGYRIEYVLNKQNYRFEKNTDYVFNGEAFDLGVPEAIDGARFVGWYLLNENGEEVKQLTDSDGKGSRWELTDKNSYTVRAKWEN